MRTIMYALYKGDEILTIGSIKELALYLNVSIETIRFYTTPTYRKRCKKGNNYLVIRIEED